MKTKVDSLQALMSAKPVPIKLEKKLPIQVDFLDHKYGRVAVFYAEEPSVDLSDWMDQNLTLIDNTFQEYGALLFRGFATANAGAFVRLAKQLSSELIDYCEPSTPRTKVADYVYTSTEYPKEQFIPLHNEQSYSHHWPTKIWFYCETPAKHGGETPIADSRKVYQLIDPQIRRLFETRGVMYVRNYGEHLDLKWQNVFQTDDRMLVEEYCRKASINYEWTATGNLRSRQVGQAVITHPRTGEMVWFNQAHLFHVSSLEPEVQTFLLKQFGEENLPRNAYFGDGTTIEGEVLDEIRNAYKQAEIDFEWQTHDILMLDNVLFAHGRRPFRGERRVLVALADPSGIQEQSTMADQLSSKQAIRNARLHTASHFVGKLNQRENPEILKYKLAASFRIMLSEGLDEGGISGHISLRVPDEPECFWVNPFGLLAEEVTPANLIKVDKAGTVVEGEHPVNVAGFCIHSAIHAARPEVNCVVHTHSPWGTLFSALQRPIEPIDQNCCMFFENHALHREYGGPVNNSDDVARVVESLGRKDVLILSNHGTITCGATVESATMLMVAVERAYRLNVLALQADKLETIPPEIARQTRDWIANPIGLAIEFNALLRKIERLFPEFRKFAEKAYGVSN